jgi:hypothetical protein
MRRALRGIRLTLAAGLALLAVVAGSYAVHRQPAPSTRSVLVTPTSSRPTTTTVPRPPSGLAWQPLGQPVGGRSALQVAFLGGSATDPTQVAVWIDKTLAVADLIPGKESPGGANWDPFARVPAAKQVSLLAAFNGGMPFTDAQGGFYAQNRTAYPLVSGAASLVIRADGTAAVGQWGRDVKLAPDVVAVRQNLVLLVDGRAATAAANRPYPAWGVTPDGSPKVWRSAVGVDAGGNLVYVAARNLDPPALAVLALAAGCVQAMQLDIGWPNVAFNTYRQSAPGAIAGSKAMTIMSQPGDRYLTPDARDFVVVYLRTTR